MKKDFLKPLTPLFFLFAAPLFAYDIAPQSDTCFGVLRMANQNLERRLSQQDAAIAARSAPIVADEPARAPAIVPEGAGSVLKRMLATSARPITERQRPVIILQPLQRAVLDRLFVIQDFVLSRGEAYVEWRRGDQGIDPAVQGPLKKWIDQRFDKVVRALSRDHMNQETLATLEIELNDVASDINAISNGGADRNEVLARFAAHQGREFALAASRHGLTVLQIVSGVVNPVTVPEPLQRHTPAPWVLPVEKSVAKPTDKPIEAPAENQVEEIVAEPKQSSAVETAVKPMGPLQQIIRQARDSAASDKAPATVPAAPEALPLPEDWREGDLDVDPAIFGSPSPR